MCWLLRLRAHRTDHMVHGLCGVLNPSCPCMQDGLCTKHYPKLWREETAVNINCVPAYRRRETTPPRTVKKRALGYQVHSALQRSPPRAHGLPCERGGLHVAESNQVFVQIYLQRSGPRVFEARAERSLRIPGRSIRGSTRSRVALI